MAFSISFWFFLAVVYVDVGITSPHTHSTCVSLYVWLRLVLYMVFIIFSSVDPTCRVQLVMTCVETESEMEFIFRTIIIQVDS